MQSSGILVITLALKDVGPNSGGHSGMIGNYNVCKLSHMINCVRFRVLFTYKYFCYIQYSLHVFFDPECRTYVDLLADDDLSDGDDVMIQQTIEDSIHDKYDAACSGCMTL